MDVKGAFDAVLPGRLVNHLREQGWSNKLVKWVQSFATNRYIKIRLDGEIGPKTKLECSLPQGSPISPILFILYIVSLFWMGNPRKRFGTHWLPEHRGETWSAQMAWSLFRQKTKLQATYTDSYSKSPQRS
ncbi:hypothetical protein SS1G_01269 [Sclerotinia sclerotiorum 1980 UF-70]|uniref:Uncharacterized protein n=1 Tax=Sclerotinia sclerotiorum (strain ATCC 18683 / 1980 / Ss-1) TaxID=665079 RepID=A7E7J1_SCLS1|nr:hypothetical protein SS1G_01269 [Sclerotinia sclerotiorum 1980 UF-70]EDN96343.1 hypothetical protein SS1G_01269 [Sclerotinia sclerotiorum 1980 UF-70]